MIIDIEHVTWQREQLTLLKDVSWKVAPGEHWALLGLNGSGKTTLLNLVNGYFGRPKAPSACSAIASARWICGCCARKSLGQHVAAGEAVRDRPDAEYRHQRQARDDRLVRPRLGGRLYRARRDGDAGRSHLWDREFRTCSQGEKQKLLIARALMAQPRILILDEPCNGLDLFSRERLLASIKDLTEREDAPTLIYAHPPHTEEILPAFTHALLIRGGEIVRSGRDGGRAHDRRAQRLLRVARGGGKARRPGLCSHSGITRNRSMPPASKKGRQRSRTTICYRCRPFRLRAFEAAAVAIRRPS